MRPLRSLVTRVGLVLVGGAGLGAAGAAASGLWSGAPAWAAGTAPTCTQTSSTAVTIALAGDATSISSSGTSQDLVVQDPALTTPVIQCYNTSSSPVTVSLAGTTITFTSSTVTDLTIDQSSADLPANTTLTGTLGGGTLTVKAGATDNLNFGSNGFTLTSATGAALDNITAAQPYQVTSAAGGPTVSGGGDTATGSATTSPVVLSAHPSATAYNIVSNVTFDAANGNGSYSISASGSGDQVNAGTGTQTINLTGSNTTITGGGGADAINITGSSSGNNDVIGVSGGTYSIAVASGSTGNQITGGTGSETFTVTGQATPFTGSAGGSYTLDAILSATRVSAGSGTETFTIPDPTSGVTFAGGSDLSGNDTFNLTSVPGSSNGNQSNVNDTFDGGAGTDAFNVTGGTANNNNTYNGGAGTDTVTINGSNNVFNAGPAPATENFYDAGSSNTVNFSGVGASKDAELYVNVSGSSQFAGTTLLNNGQATLTNSTHIYTFHDSPSVTTSNDFTLFYGDHNGYTNFDAGGSGGLSLVGSSAGNNSASFYGSTGVVSNLSSGLQILTDFSLGSAAADSVTSFEIGAGQVLVAPPTGTATSCSGSPIASFCDALTGVNTVTGPSAGYSTFYAGDAPATFTFSDAGDHNTFIGGTGQASFSSAGNYNTFVAGDGTENFTDTTTSLSPSNQIDFSAVPTGSSCSTAPCSLLINVSGSNTTLKDYVAALFDANNNQIATYTFGGSSGGANFTSFVGATAGHTTFQGGAVVGAAPTGFPTYRGQGAGNTLDFSEVPSPANGGPSSLTLDVTSSPFPRAVLGSVTDTFSGVTNLVGLLIGNTTFKGGSTGGYSFTGNGTGNSADFSAQQPSTGLSVTVSIANPSPTPANVGTVSFYLPGNPTPICAAVPVTNGSAACYAQNLPAGPNQFEAVYSPPAGATFTGSGYVISNSSNGNSTTTTTTVGSIAGPVYQYQKVSLNATVLAANGSPVPAGSGTVTFSIAGGQILCASGISSVTNSTTPNASCDVLSLPAGTDDILAVFTPSDPSTYSGSVNGSPLVVTVSNQQVTSVTSVTYYPYNPSNPGSNPCKATDCVSALVSGIPTGDSGTVTFYYDSTTAACSASSPSAAPGGLLFSCSPFQTSFNLPQNGVVFTAVFTPGSGQPVGISSSVGTSAPVLDDLFGSSVPSTPTLICSNSAGSCVTGISVVGSGTLTTGTRYAIQATVETGTQLSGTLTLSSTSATISGGTVTFYSAGTAVCTSPVGQSLYYHDTVTCVTGPWTSLAGPLSATYAAPSGATYTGAVTSVSASPAAAADLPGGTLTFYLDSGFNSTQICSVTVPGGATSATVECSTPFPAGANTIVAFFTPSTGSVAGSAASQSITVSDPVASTTAPNGVSTQDLAPGVTINLGTSVVTTLTANLFATNSQTFTGGTVTFTLANGTVLCSAVPIVITSGSASATAGCVTSIPLGGQALTATYTPPSGSTLTWSTSAVSVAVSGGSVLVAAPPSTSSSPTCSASSLPTFCDSLSNVSVVTGSSGGHNIFVAGGSSEQFSDNGTVGADIIDFAGVSAGAGSTLTVNVSGVGTSDYTATLGTFTYNFQQGGPGFTTIIGSSGGYTTFEAGGTGGYTFLAQNTNNTADFSADPSPISANLSNKSWTSPSSVVLGPDQILVSGGTCPGSCDSISGISTVVGSSGGNIFVAGTGSEVFKGGTGNTVDFSNLTTPVVVNVSQAGQSPQSTNYGTATSAGAIYDFTNFVGTPITFVGSPGSTTFYAGSQPDTFKGQGLPGDTLNFTAASGTTLVICTVGWNPSGCSQAGQALLGNTTESFSGITSFDGLSASSSTAPVTTSFVAGGTGGLTFSGVGGTNSLDFSPAPAGVVANLSLYPYKAGSPTNPFTVGAGQVLVAAPVPGSSCLLDPSVCDSFSGITIVTGSTGGGNTFVAGSKSETFRDVGTKPTDTIDFSNVAAGSSAPLTINVTGIGTATYQATFGTVTYDFTRGSTDFTHLIGSTGGFTTFLAGDPTDYTFTGQGGGNTADFSAASCPVRADLGTGEVTTAPSCVGTGTDTIGDIATVVGSSGGGNTFVAGTGGNEFFQGGTGNTVDFSGLTKPVVVNVSAPGQSPQSTAYGTATSNGTTYDFTNFDAYPTTFVGSAAGTTFYAGSQADTFKGQGNSDTLNFTDVSGSTSLLICVVASIPSGCSQGGVAQLGTTTEYFSGITAFDGLSSSLTTTTFVTGGQGGLTFVGVGGTNSLDFSPAPGGVVVNLSNQSYGALGNTFSVGPGQALVGVPVVTAFSCGASVSLCDSFSNISTVTGSSAGHNVFVAGVATQTFADNGTVGQDTIDFTNVRTTTSSTPLTVNASNTSANGLSPYTAAFGTNTYSFAAGGTGFVDFIGASSGNTRFQASGDAYGLTFDGQGSGNTADFSQSTNAVTVDMVTGQVTFGTGTANSDSLTGTFATVIGSAYYTNTFYGALTGTQFTSTGSSNEVSYVDLANLPAGAGVRLDLTTDQVSLYCAGATSCPPSPNPFGVDTFSFPSGGTLTIQGSPGNDYFILGGNQPVRLLGDGGQDTIDLSRVAAPSTGSAGVDVSLADGLITGPTIGQVSFTTGCAGTDLCVTTVIGSPYNDTFTLSGSASAPSPSINGNGGTDTLDLSQIATTSVITMPLDSAPLATCGTLTSVNCGTVTGGVTVYFTAIPDVIGTAAGGDTVYVGTGTQSFTDGGSSGSNYGTLDYSKLGTGITLSVQDVSGDPQGSVSSPTGLVTNNFYGFDTFNGTASGSDTFKQLSAGNFNFNGDPNGSNTLDLTGAPAGITIKFVPTGASCLASSNNDGTATLSGQVSDTFQCISEVLSSGTLTFDVSPGQDATLSGGGSGTLVLIGSTTPAVVDLATGTVTGGSGAGGAVYDFSFTGMSTIDGTGLGDLIDAGAGNYTINEPGGSNTISFLDAPAAVIVNDSNSGYTSPNNVTVPAFTTSGGYGGTIVLNGITNIVGTSRYNDILVAGAGPGTLVGGTGADRFVLTGGNDIISGGTGASTLDMSELNTATSLDLGTSSPQQLGVGAGWVTLQSGNIQTVVASPSGSQIWGGNGNLTLIGGPGNDWLAGGNALGGTQTLIGNGGTDTLLGGVDGTFRLEGGTQSSVFVPGEGTEILTSQTTGNTLSYLGNPNPIQVNLSGNNFTVPPSEPFTGTVLDAGTATGGWGASVSLSGASISTVVGTPEADIFVTGPSGNTIQGGGGNDLFVIDSANNTLTAGAGSASRFLFDGSLGNVANNVINGGGASTVDFSQVPGAVTVNLQQQTATGGQSLRQVLNIIGSRAGGSVLTAGGPGATITSLGANDVLIAYGNDTLIDQGPGGDTFCAESSCSQGAVTGAGNTMIGGVGNDTFFAQNGGPDTINGGGGYNQAQVDPVDKTSNISYFIP